MAMPERAIKKCVHGVPFFGQPEPTCDHCGLIWHRWCLEENTAAVARHSKRVAFLEMRIKSQASGDA